MKKELLVGVSTIPGQFITNKKRPLTDVAKQFISLLKSKA